MKHASFEGPRQTSDESHQPGVSEISSGSPYLDASRRHTSEMERRFREQEKIREQNFKAIYAAIDAGDMAKNETLLRQEAVRTRNWLEEETLREEEEVARMLQLLHEEQQKYAGFLQGADQKSEQQMQKGIAEEHTHPALEEIHIQPESVIEQLRIIQSAMNDLLYYTDQLSLVAHEYDPERRRERIDTIIGMQDADHAERLATAQQRAVQLRDALNSQIRTLEESLRPHQEK